MKHSNALGWLCLVVLVIAPGVLFAQNPNCTIIVPNAPLTAAGLATPYLLQPADSNPDDTGFTCHETDPASSAFVQAAIFDPATGQISIYNPLVIDEGSAPSLGSTIVTPTLPPNAVVALWFGFNGNVLTQGGDPSNLQAANCVNGLPNSEFGQFSYCNAPAFFKAANRAIRQGKLRVPWLGLANDHQPCPTVRDFAVVDQDQSDNLPVTYLIGSDGLLAQNTQANQAALGSPTTLGNPSDNGLLDRFMDPALGCSPWKVDDLADPGQKAAGLPLNELQARAWQRSPAALIPLGDPMTLNTDGSTSLTKTNAYRAGVDQPEARYPFQADTARYCRDMLRIAPARLLLDQAAFTAAPSPVAENPNLFTFLAQRFTSSLDILGCADLVKIPNPVSLTLDANGNATAASINLPVYNRCKRMLGFWDRLDWQWDEAAHTAASTN